MQFKQVIVVRKELNMRKGKIGAQIGHLSQKFNLDNATFTEDGFCVNWADFGKHEEAVKSWFTGKYAKIVVATNSLEEFEELAKKARERDLIVTIVTDSGATEFHGVPTKTVMSIGPANVDDFIGLTDHLKLI